MSFLTFLGFSIDLLLAGIVEQAILILLTYFVSATSTKKGCGTTFWNTPAFILAASS
jgi:hypothetical protein